MKEQTDWWLGFRLGKGLEFVYIFILWKMTILDVVDFTSQNNLRNYSFAHLELFKL
jgi:hypothetical protein